MATFTKLDDAALAALLEQYPMGRLYAAAPIVKGTINSNYRVDTDGGRYFLRVNEGKAHDEVLYEAELVRWLSQRGVATPAVILSKDGAPAVQHGATTWVTLFAWLEGAELGLEEIAPDHARTLGAALARVHAAGADFERRRAGRYTFDQIEKRYHSFAGSRDAALARVIDVVGDELAWLSAGDRKGLPGGVIHQDLFRDNVLWSDRAAATLAGLIDFEQACDGTFAYDLAVCLNDWCWTGTDYAGDRAKALLAGYQSVRELGAKEKAGLWVEARASAMRFTVTRVTDIYLRKEAAALREEKDFNKYLARLDKLRKMGRSGFATLTGL